MRNALVCWAPECGALVAQPATGRPRLYCSPAHKMRARRRNGDKPPTEPYPPLEPTPLQQDATAATVGTEAAGGETATSPEQSAAGRPATSPPQVPARTPERAGTHPGTEQRSTDTGDAPAASPAGTEGAATVTQLHVAITEDSTVPVKVTVHPMVAAYKADVAKLGKANDRQGLQVIEMAEKLVSSATSPAAAANLSKELQRLMDTLEASSNDALVNQDPSLIIRDRTLAKLRAIQDAAEASA